MTLKEWNKKQIEESKSDLNRYYFWLKYRREGTDKELLEYYIFFGGAYDFKKNNSYIEVH